MVAMSFESARRKAGDFYVLMAGVCTLVAFGGFLPTYWLQLPAGTFVGPPLLHVHGLLFSAWPLLLLSQPPLFPNANQVFEVNNADKILGLLLIDRQPRVLMIEEEPQYLVERGIHGNADDRSSRHHDFASRVLA